jgi:hypothetical protein
MKFVGETGARKDRKHTGCRSYVTDAWSIVGESLDRPLGSLGDNLSALFLVIVQIFPTQVLGANRVLKNPYLWAKTARTG